MGKLQPLNTSGTFTLQYKLIFPFFFCLSSHRSQSALLEEIPSNPLGFFCFGKPLGSCQCAALHLPCTEPLFSVYQGLNSTFLSSVPRKFLKILTDIVCVESNPWTHYFVVSSLWEKQDTPYNCQGFLHFPYFIDTLFSFFFFSLRKVPRSKTKQYNRRADR